MRSIPIISLLWGLICMIAGGTPYAFGLYSQNLKDTFGLSQPKTLALASFLTMGLYVGGIPAGMVHDKFGHRITLILAMICLGGGYFGVATMLDNFKESSSVGATTISMGAYFLLSILFFIIGMGSGSSYTGNLMVNVKNWHPSKRGRIVGVSVSFFGLSAFFFSALYKIGNFAERGPVSFLKTVGLITSMICLIGTFLIKLVGFKKIEDNGDISKSLLVEYPDHLEDSSIQSTKVERTNSDALLKDVGGFNLFADPHIRLDFFLLYFSFAIIIGSAVFFITSLGSISNSIVGDTSKKVEWVAEGSLANAFGRLVFGILMDISIKKGLHRGWYGTTAAILVGVGFIIASFGTVQSITVSVFIIVTGLGCAFSTAPTLLSLCFGTNRFGTNWGILLTGPGIFMYLFGEIGSFIFDSHIKSGMNTCYGADCYRTTFFILAILNSIAALLMRIFVVNTHKLVNLENSS